VQHARRSHFSPCNYPNNTGWGVQITKQVEKKCVKLPVECQGPITTYSFH
jgi:hypothetical protein